MKRTQIYLTKNLHAQVKMLAQQQGISFSEMLRRILDDFFKKHPKPGLNTKTLKKYDGFIKAKDLRLAKGEKIKGQELIDDYYTNDVV